MVALVMVHVIGTTPILGSVEKSVIHGIRGTAVKRACHARKTGRAVAHCSLEDVQPFRILEVPLWMLDVAVGCKIRVAQSGLANVESLRELKGLLHSAPRARGDIAWEAQHRYLLDAGGADVHIADSRETPSTPVVCSSACPAAWEGSVARCSTENSAMAEAVAAAAWRPISGREPGRGGAR